MSQRGDEARGIAAMKWRDEYNAKYPAPKQGKKRCTLCKQMKKFDTEDRDISEFHIRKNQAYKSQEAGMPHSTYFVPDAWCKVCKNKKTEERRRIRRDADPEKVREIKRAQDKRYRKKIGEKKWLEMKRVRSNRYRRKRGIGLDHDVAPRKSTSGMQVPVEPLVEWINESWPYGGAYTDIKNAVPNSDKLSKIMNGRQDVVDMEWVDEVLTRFNGPHLSTLYPEVYDG